jgi:hypothetical protein
MTYLECFRRQPTGLAWFPTPPEIERIAQGAPIYLTVMGSGAFGGDDVGRAAGLN